MVSGGQFLKRGLPRAPLSAAWGEEHSEVKCRRHGNECRDVTEERRANSEEDTKVKDLSESDEAARLKMTKCHLKEGRSRDLKYWPHVAIFQQSHDIL